MSRNRKYQSLLNSKRWKILRQQYLRDHPLCERCLREGFNTAAVDIHHKTPCESAQSDTEMERLCYDRNNLEALCIPCHIKTHQEMRSHTKEAHKQRQDDRLQQWISRHSPGK